MLSEEEIVRDGSASSPVVLAHIEPIGELDLDGRPADLARRRRSRARCAPTSRFRACRASARSTQAPAVLDDGFVVPSPQA